MLLSLTFLTGLAIGAYVYVMVFRPMYTSDTLSDTESEASEWSLVSRKRDSDSALGYVQPSFRLLGDGSYSYIPATSGDGLAEPKEGKISRSVMQELRGYDNILMKYSYSTPGSECAADSGGYDYEYRFTKSNISFSLDTCYTNLGYNTPLSLTLKKVWQEIEGGTTMSRPDGFSDWAEGWIRANVGVEGGE